MTESVKQGILYNGKGSNSQWWCNCIKCLRPKLSLQQNKAQTIGNRTEMKT